MVNIFYSYTQNGPGKVLNNLKKGLNQLGIEYAENTMQYEFNIFLSLTPDIIKCDLKKTIVGPNIGFDNTMIQEQKYKLYIAPSKWTKDLFVQKVGLKEEKIFIWPVGIDTQKFNQLPSNKIYDFLIYFKRRDRDELRKVIEFLNKKNKTFTIIEYGHYDENSFIESISNSKYGIVIDGTESQGIAIQEMMSCNLPLLVWDVEYWNDMGDSFKCVATSVPYFDDRCGIKFYSIEELEQKYETFINSNYSPRDFILEKLSLKKTTSSLIEILNINIK
jgi:hypothetical protein